LRDAVEAQQAALHKAGRGARRGGGLDQVKDHAARVCPAQLSLNERPVAHECLERSNGHALGVCVAAHNIAQQMPQCLEHVVRARGGLGRHS
jgi:hypothetical protein